ncbi:MAG: lipopolysaccharide biosynthesis protein [Algiphilus sp.]
MNLVHASATSVMVRAAFQGLGFAITVLLARELGAEAFGAYTYALVIIMLLALPCRAGLPQIVTRETATSMDPAHWPVQEGVWRWAIRLALMISLLVVGITAWVLSAFAGSFSTETRILLLCALPLIPAMVIAEINGGALRGAGYVIRGQIPESLIRPASQLMLLAIMTMAIASGQFTALQAMAVFVAAACLAAVSSFAMLRVARPYGARCVVPESRGREWLAAVVPISLINSMHLINTQADTFLVGLFVGTQEVGFYRVAVQVSLLVAFGLHATKLVVQPRFAALYRDQAFEALQWNVVWFARINLVFACAVLIALVTAGQQLLPKLFGSGFGAAYVPLVVLGAGHVLGALFGASGVLLVMAGFERQFVRFGVLAAVINVGLNIVLIPQFGMNGAALATAATMPIPHILGWWFARRHLHCNCSPLAMPLMGPATSRGGGTNIDP